MKYTIFNITLDNDFIIFYIFMSIITIGFTWVLLDPMIRYKIIKRWLIYIIIPINLILMFVINYWVIYKVLIWEIIKL